MKIVVLGCGMQGSVAAGDLVRSGHRVTVVDTNRANLKAVSGLKNVRTLQLDVKKQSRLVEVMKDFDVVLGALPAALGFYSMQCAIAAGVDIVDMSYLPEDPFILEHKAKRGKIRVVPDAGFAPGLSNIIIGAADRELGGIDRLRILVGGLPQEPLPPFNYRITWSPADLIEEYTRPSRLIRNFKMVVKEALSGIEEFSFPKIGRLECFYTDGLRTFLRTFQHVKNMEEKTIRYPGHARLFKTLIDCGFLSASSLIFNGSPLCIRDFNLELLKKLLTKGKPRDVSLLIIEIASKRKKRRYVCTDYYDEKNRITSMARMTAFTGSIITQSIKNYAGYGVIAPEMLGRNRALASFIMREIKKRGIAVRQLS